MNVYKSSNNVSIVTNDSHNVRGIQNLEDSPITKIINESKTNSKNLGPDLQ